MRKAACGSSAGRVAQQHGQVARATLAADARVPEKWPARNAGAWKRLGSVQVKVKHLNDASLEPPSLRPPTPSALDRCTRLCNGSAQRMFFEQRGAGFLRARLALAAK